MGRIVLNISSSTRWIRAGLATSLVAGIAVCSVAVAAAPKRGAQYAGSGVDYFIYPNGSSVREPHRHSRITFGTSKDGRRVVHFKGYYDYYCGAGTSYINDKSVGVKSNGTFADTGSVPTRGPNGAINGRLHIKLSGRFVNAGKAASVTYVTRAVFTGDPSHPCTTRVKGRVHLR
jgi:hypothetical protein